MLLTVTPSVISRRLHGLEQDLGVVLIIRHGGRGGVELSPAGHLFLREASAVMHHLEWLRASFGEAVLNAG